MELTIEKPICLSCNNLENNNTIFTCKAFPNGIPDIIVYGENKHDKPLINQGNTIVYEKK